MVVTVSCNIKLDNSGLKEVLKAVEYLKNNVVHSGVINADPETTKIAAMNEFGGHTTYKYGPYAGEPVEVPQRSFIGKSLNRKDKKILDFGFSFFENGFSESNAKSALNGLGDMSSKEQRFAIESNGENVPGWQKWQDYRTIETKGHDRPLFTRNGDTFPIDYEVVRKDV